MRNMMEIGKNGYTFGESSINIIKIFIEMDELEEFQGVRFTGNQIQRIELPGGGVVDYCKNFLTPEFGAFYYKYLRENLPYVRPEMGNGRKMNKEQSWMSDEGVKAKLYQKQPATIWPREAMIVKEELERVSGSKVNYCLVNLYNDHTESLGYHHDEEVFEEEEGRDDVISLSLGATRKFHMKHKTDNAPGRLNAKLTRSFMLSEGSLLIMRGKETQNKWLHAVPTTSVPCGARINLTYRYSSMK